MVRVDGSGSDNALIQVRNLNKQYKRGSETIDVLQGLNLDVEAGEFVAFMGPSGSGKTTLLNLLGGLDVPTSGTVTVDGDEITHMSGSKLAKWRARHVGFIFQMYNLMPVLTARAERRTPPPADQALQEPAPAAGGDRALPRRALRSHGPLSAPAFRRPGTAGGHRPRHRHRPHIPPRGRAHRRSRSAVGGRNPRSHHRACRKSTGRPFSW